MESPRQPEVKSEAAQGTPTTPAGQVAEPARRYPKPPVLPLRLLLLCFKPESWPMAARYPTRFTLIPLVVAIVFSAVIAAMGDAERFARNVNEFAAAYQTQYAAPPLAVTADGNLKATDTFKDPIHFSSTFFCHIIVDPANKTNPESIKTPFTWLVGDREVRWILAPGVIGDPAPLNTYLKQLIPGGTPALSASQIREFAAPSGAAFGLFLMLGFVAGNILWAAVIMFLVCPLVMLTAAAGQRRLILPRRAAYRMAAAFLIPLVIFSGAMHAAGYSIFYMMGADNCLIFWSCAAAALAVWTGLMAKKMYTKAPVRRAH